TAVINPQSSSTAKRAFAYVRTSKKLADVNVKSVKKKLKDKRFAASVSREDIQQGVEELGVDMDEHIGFTIAAMQEIAETIGF
ncbi:MAG: hypothetical protein AAFP70_20965, partial [Calditrichota bacterium]